MPTSPFNARDLYTGDGAQTDFAVTTAPVAQAHIEVTLGGVAQVLGTDYSFFTADTIRFNSAPANAASIVFKRVTPSTAAPDFEDGGIPSASKLDLANQVSSYISQEADDAAQDALDAVAGAGNVPAPIDGTDDGKVLSASGGSFSWVSFLVSQLSGVAAFMQTFLTSATAALARSNLGAAGLTDNNTLSGTNTHTATNNFRGDVNIVRTAELSGRVKQGGQRKTADDVVGETQFVGFNSVDQETRYADIFARCITPTDGVEDGRLEIRAARAGSLFSSVAHFGPGGIHTPSATNGDQGADTINAKGYYVDGKRPGPVLLASAEASNQANLDASWTGNWRMIKVVYTAISPVTDNAQPRLRLSNDGGTTFADTAPDYDWVVQRFNLAAEAGNGSAADDFIGLYASTTGVGSGAQEHLSASFDLYATSEASLTTMIEGAAIHDNNSDAMQHVSLSARRLDAEVTNGIRLYFSTGNVSSGRVDVYGIDEI